jgi:hypothetical protein
MSLGKLEGLQSLEPFIPCGAMGVPDKANGGQDVFPFIAESRVAPNRLKLVLVPLSV